MNQSEIEAITSNYRQARENACEEITIDFGFTSDWLRKRRELFYPIRERKKENQSKHNITFDTHLKTALRSNFRIRVFIPLTNKQHFDFTLHSTTGFLATQLFDSYINESSTYNCALNTRRV